MTTIQLVLGIIGALFGLVVIGAGAFFVFRGTLDTKIKNNWKEHAEALEVRLNHLRNELNTTKSDCAQRISELEGTVKVLRSEHSGEAAIKMVGEMLVGKLDEHHKLVLEELRTR